MNFIKSALMISALVIVGLFSSAAHAQPLMEKVPSDVNAYFYTKGANAEFMKTSFAKLLKGEELVEVEKQLKKLAAQFAPKDLDLKKAMQVFSLARSLAESPMVAFDQSEGNPKMPVIRIGLLIDTTEYSDQFDSVLDFMLDQLAQNRVLPTSQMKTKTGTDQTEYTSWAFHRKSKMTVNWGKIKGTNLFFLILTNDAKFVDVVLNTKKDSSILSNKKHNKFVSKVTYKDVAPQFTIYADCKKSVKLARKMIAASKKKRALPVSMKDYESPIVRYIKFFGGRKSQAYVAKVFVEGKGFVTKTKSFAKSEALPKSCILNLEGSSLESLKIAPKDTTVFAQVNLKINAVEKILADLYSMSSFRDYRYKTKKQKLEDFQADMEAASEFMGINPLKKLKELSTGRISLVSADSLGGKLTGTVLVLDVTDEAGAAMYAKKMLEILAEKMSYGISRPYRQAKILKTKQGKTDIYYISMAHWRMPPVNPCFAVKGKKLYIAAYPQVLQSALTKRKTSLTDSKKIRTLFKNLANGSQIVAYGNIRYVARELYPYMLLAGSAITTEVRRETRGMIEIPLIPSKYSKFWKAFCPEFHAIKVDKEGLEYNSYGTVPNVFAIAVNFFAANVQAIDLISYHEKIRDVHWDSTRNLRRISHMIGISANANYESWEELFRLIIKSKERYYILNRAQWFFKSTASNNPFPTEVYGRDPDGDRIVVDIKNIKDYILLPNDPNKKGKKYDSLISVYENPENWDNQGTYVLLRNGRVKWLEIEKFKELLIATKNEFPRSS